MRVFNLLPGPGRGHRRGRRADHPRSHLDVDELGVRVDPRPGMAELVQDHPVVEPIVIAVSIAVAAAGFLLVVAEIDSHPPYRASQPEWHSMAAGRNVLSRLTTKMTPGRLRGRHRSADMALLVRIDRSRWSLARELLSIARELRAVTPWSLPTT